MERPQPLCAAVSDTAQPSCHASKWPDRGSSKVEAPASISGSHTVRAIQHDHIEYSGNVPPLDSKIHSSLVRRSEPRPKRAYCRRTKTGCYTCRLRKKKCDEHRPICLACTRGGFHCQGYSSVRGSLAWQKILSTEKPLLPRSGKAKTVYDQLDDKTPSTASPATSNEREISRPTGSGQSQQSQRQQKLGSSSQNYARPPTHDSQFSLCHGKRDNHTSLESSPTSRTLHKSHTQDSTITSVSKPCKKRFRCEMSDEDFGGRLFTCGQRFTTKRDLDRHRSSKHEKRVVAKCKVCMSRTYRSKDNAVRHAKAKHWELCYLNGTYKPENVIEFVPYESGFVPV